MISPIKILLFSAFIFSFQLIISQHIDIDKKALAFLENEQNINIVFDYENLSFNEENIKEEDYLKEIQNKLLEDKGQEEVDEWMNIYNISKDSIWPEIFTSTLNKKLKEYKNGPKFKINNSNAKYTMKINNSWMYFGYNVVAAKWPSKVLFDITFYETKNPTNIIFKTKIDKALGTNNEVYKLDKEAKFRRVGKAYHRGAYKLAQSFKRIVD